MVVTIEIVRANYTNAQHQDDIVSLLDHYASGPMGGGCPLADEVRTSLVDELSRRPYAFSLLAYDGDRAVGLVNGFEGFSTFACRPLLNVHDIVVLDGYRGRGISQLLLQEVERMARDSGCCKITLEVLSHNESAKAAYRKFGFEEYTLAAEAGTALFWHKPL